MSKGVISLSKFYSILSSHTLLQMITHSQVCLSFHISESNIYMMISFIILTFYNNNNGPNGHLFYVGGDLIMRRGMLPVIILPDGDLCIVLHIVPFF